MAKESIKKAVGKRLRTIRKKNNLTLKKVSNLFPGYAGSDTLSRYETGDRAANLEFLILFGKHFNLNPEWLFYGTGPQQLSGKGEPKKPEVIYFELIESLKDKPIDYNNIMSTWPKLMKEFPDNILILLKILSMDEETNDDLIKYFYTMIMEKAVKRLKNQSSIRSNGTIS